MSEPLSNQSDTAKPVPWTRLLLPVFAFCVMLLWSNIPPYREHIKHEERSYFVWHWHLFWQGGLKVCDVRYYDMNQGGALLERWKLLGYDRPRDMPDEIARVHQNELRADQNRVCQALRAGGDAQPNVELWARCGVGYGWKQISNRKGNVCAAKPVKPAKPKPKAKPAPRPTPSAEAAE
jgi:hypothetical protein